jgi:ribosomal protein S1
MASSYASVRVLEVDRMRKRIALSAKSAKPA